MVAKEMDIPLKTVEKWVTAYYKDPKVFEVPEGEEPVCPVCKARGENLEPIEE